MECHHGSFTVLTGLAWLKEEGGKGEEERKEETRGKKEKERKKENMILDSFSMRQDYADVMKTE